MISLTEVKYQPELTRTYLGSPSVVRLPDGALVVSHDYYGKGCPRNHESEESLTSIYRSTDDGASWLNVTHIMNCYWSSLFEHAGALYILGTSQQYGSIVIRRSDDGGFTWTHPTDPENGWLFAGGYYHDGPNYHCAPVAVTVHDGRIYKAFEDCTPCVWGTGFQACVISAPIEADLLDANNWTMSNKVPFDPAWVPKEWGRTVKPGWREGNVVADRDGQLWDIMSFEAGPLEAEMAARIKIEDGGKRISFVPETGYFELPGCKAKLTIRHDPVSNKYFTIANALDDLDILRRWSSGEDAGSTRFHRDHAMRQRNKAFLLVSDDLWTWRRVKLLISDDTGLGAEHSIQLTGFQYTDFQFDGPDDLIFAVRCAYRGAANFHDANRIMFGRVPNFRRLV
jgi:hypothetical protein